MIYLFQVPGLFSPVGLASLPPSPQHGQQKNTWVSVHDLHYAMDGAA